MISLLRKYRKKLSGDNNFKKYSRYAIGEIFLVVIGILIALQINTWNEDRKANNAFEFSLKQLHKELMMDYLMNTSITDAYMAQFNLIDSIQRYPDNFKKENFPYVLQSLDFSFLTKKMQRLNLDFRKSLVLFKRNDDFQNKLSTLLLKYINDDQHITNVAGIFKDQPTLKEQPILDKYLEEFHIPFRNFTPGNSLSYFYNLGQERGYLEINELSESYTYKPENIEEMYSLLNRNDFQADLQTLKNNKMNAIGLFEVQTVTAKSLLDLIEDKISETKFGFDMMHIVGTGTEHANWFNDVPLTPVDDSGLIWELETILNDGYIKFRTDDLWTFNWGRAYSNPNELLFDGPDFKVSKGVYKITLNLKDSSYEFKRLK